MSDTGAYSRLDYRRLIAWPERIRREGPILEELFEKAPCRRIVDLGCGTGEHARFLASRGFQVTGVDQSEEMLEKARAEDATNAVTWLRAGLAEVDTLLPGSFGGAICLGNVLPHLGEERDLTRFFRGLAALLLPGAPLLLQILNYEKILGQNQRYLPLNFRPPEGGEEGEIVFLRLMTPRPDGTVVFNPATLRYRPGAEPPLEVIAARNVSLRGWRLREVETELASAGFASFTFHGDIRQGPFVPAESSDLVVIARR